MCAAQPQAGYIGSRATRTQEGMLTFKRRLHALRHAVNLSSALILLVFSTALAAQVLGVPDFPQPPEGEEEAGVLLAVTIVGFGFMIFGTPLVLAINILDRFAGSRRQPSTESTPQE